MRWKGAQQLHRSASLIRLDETQSPGPRWLGQSEFGFKSLFKVHPPNLAMCVTKQPDQIKPISYLKALAAEVVRNLSTKTEPLVITQNGEAKAVMQDIKSYEQIQETMSLLKILALGQRQIDEGKVQPAGDVAVKLRTRSASK